MTPNALRQKLPLTFAAAPVAPTMLRFRLSLLIGLLIFAQLSTRGLAESLNEALRAASIDGDKAQIVSLLAKGANLSATNSKGTTPLIFAACWDRTDAALALLAAGANPRDKNNPGWTALAYSTYWGNLPLTKALLSKGANINDQFGQGHSIFWSTLIGGNPDILRLLLASNAKIPATVDDEGRTPLQIAARHGHGEIVDILLARGVNPNAADSRGFTPLCEAIDKEQWKIAQTLIKAGANVNAFGYCGTECQLGHTALSLAAEKNNIEMARLLLAKGADAKAHGQLAMRGAESSGSVEVYQLLANAGASYPLPKDAHPAWEKIRKGQYPAPPTPSPRQNSPFIFTAAVKSPDVPIRTDSGGELRLAIITDDRVAGDILTVVVSKQAGFALVERSEIERILAEKKLSESGVIKTSAGSGFGRLLGANAVLEVSRVNADKNQLCRTRIISVETGVVLESVFHPASSNNSTQWATEVTKRLPTLKEKLTRKPNRAIALAFLNMNATLGTAQGRAVEEDFRLLLEHRVAHEPSLFVLDRTEMNQLVQEKNLAHGEASEFWNGAYLVEGKIDVPLAASDTFSVRLHLQPALDSQKVIPEITIEGDRNHLAECVEKAVGKMKELLIAKEENSASVWDPHYEAARFFQEAQWAFACNIHDLAISCAESSWALGLHTPEVARLRVASRASGILAQKERIKNSIKNATSEDFPCDPLHHPFRGLDCPTPSEFITAGIRLLEVSDEALHIDNCMDKWAINDALSAAVKVLEPISDASDKMENALHLKTYRELLRQVTNEAVEKLPDDFDLLHGWHVRMAHYFCETDAELVEFLEKEFQNHFPKDDFLNRAKLRSATVASVGYIDRDAAYLKGTRWRDAWQTFYTKLSRSELPEDRFVGSCIQSMLDTSLRERRAATNRGIEQFRALLPLIASDTRSLKYYLDVLDHFPSKYEISPFFCTGSIEKEGEDITTYSLPRNELLCKAFIFLCENSRLLDNSVFSLAGWANDIVKRYGTSSGLDYATAYATASLVKMNAALLAHIDRVAGEPGADSGYIARIKKKTFALPPGLQAASASQSPTASVPPTPSQTAQSGTLVVTKKWDPSDVTEVQGGPRVRIYGGRGSRIWAEGRLWQYGERERYSGKGPRECFVFATNLETFATEVIPLPPFDTKVSGGATMAITPACIFVCRAGEFLGVYRRDSKQWKIYPEITPQASAASPMQAPIVPLAIGDSLFLIFKTADGNSGITEFHDGRADILSSTRRNPPESPMDIPGASLQMVGNSRGDIKATAVFQSEGKPRTVNALYSSSQRAWREMKPLEERDFADQISARLRQVPSDIRSRESVILTYFSKELSGATPIKLEGASDFWERREHETLVTPLGLVFFGYGYFGDPFWFSPRDEFKKTLRPIVSPTPFRPPAAGVKTQ